MSGFVGYVCDVTVVLEYGSIVLVLRPGKGDLKAVLGGLEYIVASDKQPYCLY